MSNFIVYKTNKTNKTNGISGHIGVHNILTFCF